MSAWRQLVRRASDYAQDIYRVHCHPAVRIDDVELLADPRLSHAMRQVLYSGVYEERELSILRSTLQRDDVVLELGSGLGLLSIVCARLVGNENVTTFEANPEMEPIIRANYAANRVSPQLVMAMVGSRPGMQRFYIRKNFWASSPHEARAEGSRTVMVPVFALDTEIRRTRANYLIVDIEGGESTLFEDTDLPGISKLLIELHPDVLSPAGVDRVVSTLARLGFACDDTLSFEQERFFVRKSDEADFAL